MAGRYKPSDFSEDWRLEKSASRNHAACVGGCPRVGQRVGGDSSVRLGADVPGACREWLRETARELNLPGGFNFGGDDTRDDLGKNKKEERSSSAMCVSVPL